MNQVVFLVDVDNTLLDNDHIQADLKPISSTSSAPLAAIATGRFSRRCSHELGYRDYLGALQRYRVEHPRGHASCCRCPPSWSTIRSPIGSIREALRCARATARLGPDRHSLRRRRRFSAAQDRALRAFGGGRRPCADLHPQGAGARRCRSAAIRRGITSWSTTSRASSRR